MGSGKEEINYGFALFHHAEDNRVSGVFNDNELWNFLKPPLQEKKTEEEQDKTTKKGIVIEQLSPPATEQQEKVDIFKILNRGRDTSLSKQEQSTHVCHYLLLH